MPNSEADLPRIADVLNKHHVDYVLVGGLAVVLHGVDTSTYDLDLTFGRSDQNVERLADALEELAAKPKRWKTDQYRLRSSDLATKWLHLESSAGDIDLIVETPGVPYEAIRNSSDKLEVEGVQIVVAAVAQLLEIKRNSTRPKDRIHVELLEAIEHLKKSEP